MNESDQSKAATDHQIPTISIGVHKFSFNNVVKRLEKVFDGNGDIVRVTVPGIGLETYCFRHPSHIKTILTHKATAINKVSTMLHRVKWVMGNGTFNALDPDEWRRRRTAVAPAFRATNFMGEPQRVVDAVDSMSSSWMDKLAQSNQKIDIHYEARRLVADYSLRGFFSYDAGNRLENIVAAGIVIEDSSADWTPVWFPTPSNFKFVNASRLIRSLFFNLIEEREKSSEKPKDLLSFLLGFKDSSSKPWTNTELVEESLSTYFGANAMASPLTWAVYLVAQHPHVYEKVLRELDAELGDRTPTVPDLKQLPYLEAVLNETMRVYPPFWASPPRECSEEFEIDGLKLKKGTVLLCVRYFAQRHPNFWDDPETFYPERFLGDASNKSNPFAHLPFGGGPRMCLGRFLAPVVIQLALARMFQKWRFELPSPINYRPELDFGFGLYPKDHVWIKAKPRSS